MSLRRIVVVSKEAEVQQLAQQVSQEVFAADDLAETLDLVKTVNPDLILFDHRFSPTHIREFLNTADKNSVNIPMVIVDNSRFHADKLVPAKAGVGDCEIIRQDVQACLERSREDYPVVLSLRGSQDYGRLQQIVSQIKKSKLVSCEKGSHRAGSQKNTSDFFVDDFTASVCMVGRSRAFVKTLGMIRLVAASRCNPVLIIGETGTGKELAAKAIHTLRHPHEQFVAVNCAALTANLLESELFGHVKGSFTGADRDKTGLLELAGAGSILLDEISEMPLDLQAKLLRVLQEKTFRRVGGVKNITCHATIMASSNRNLYKEMKANRFRRDLYYRLNICPVIISPLKSPDRRKDIPLLAEYFLKTSAICPGKNPKITGLTNLALEALQKHDWPGNVRELRNVIDRAILLETTDKVGLSSIVIDGVAQTDFSLLGSEKHAFGGPDPAESAIGGGPQSPFPRPRVFLSEDRSGGGDKLAPAEAGAAGNPGQPSESRTATHIKDFSLAKAERELIARALAETGWQKTQAAALLGITRATLYAKVKQYNIKKPACPEYLVLDKSPLRDGTAGRTSASSVEPDSHIGDPTLREGVAQTDFSLLGSEKHAFGGPEPPAEANVTTSPSSHLDA